MKTRTEVQSEDRSLWWGVVFLVVALVGCRGGSTSSTETATAGSTETATATAGTTSVPGVPANGIPDDPLLHGLVTSRKACDLLTRADAEAAAGQPLPQKTENVTLGMCGYSSADFSAGADITLGSWESIKGAATAGSHQPQAVSGIGDEALILGGHGLGPLYVRKGEEGFLLNLSGPKIDQMAEADALAIQKELAQKILNRF
ncbi:MAG TPA: hypothetical protein VHL58_04370 [Thermoanaerobaculia bacterium]|nr:hypothetical protein [Thermoanaerobaculia bacterium]